MMAKKYGFTGLIFFLLISGCSGEVDETTQKQSHKETVFSDQTQALEKAKAVEQVLQIEADKQRQAIEEQSNY